MKIRNGFVSNSSSSSFTIYGVRLMIDDIKKYLPPEIDTSLNEDEIMEEMYEKGVEWYDISSKIEKDLGKEFSCFYDYEYFSMYVGRELSSLKDDETGSQFKKFAEEKIQSIINPDYQCSIINETVQC